MEHLKQANPTSTTVFQYQKQFSGKLHKRALKAIKVILEHCDNFEIKDDQNETSLFNETNHFYWDLTNVIFHLQQTLIDLGESTPTASSLQNVLDELNSLTSSIQKSLKLEPKKLAVKLKTNVITAGFQVERLTKTIDLDDSHEYKTRILDCQFDLVFYIEKLKIGMEFSNVNYVEIEKRAHDLNNALIRNLSQCKIKDQIVENLFSHYVCRNIQHAQYTIDYVVQLNNTGRFKGSLDQVFNMVVMLGKPFIEECLEALVSDSPIPKFLVSAKHLHDVITNGIGGLHKGHTLSGQKTDINIKVQKMMQEIVLSVLVNGFNVILSLNTTVEDIIAKD